MVDIRDFGTTDPTGARDSWAALQNAINAVATGAASGPVFVPAGTFKIGSQITFPSSPPAQSGVRIVGTCGDTIAGPGASVLNLISGLNRTIGSCSTTAGSATLTTTASPGFLSTDVNLLVNVPGFPGNAVITAYNSATSVTLSPAATATVSGVQATLNSPKIATYGPGMLTLEHLVLTDTSGGQAPFILTTSTVLRVSQVSFHGNGSPRFYDPTPPPPAKAGVTVTMGSTSLTSASPLFASSDVGAPIFVTGPGAPPPPLPPPPPPPPPPSYPPLVPKYTYIQQVVNSTTAVMSQTASGSVTGDQGAIAIVSSFQDAILLGGTGSNGTQDGLFGGYGTVIERCVFSGIRRAVFLRSACNSVVVRDNVISFKCGGGIDEGAVDIDGSNVSNGSNVVSGNSIEGNDVEMSFYVNGVRMNNTISNTAVGNYIADNNIIIENVAGNRPYLFTSTASNNLVVGGFAPRYPTDATPIGSNTVIVPSDSTTPIIIGNPVQFGSSASLGFFGGSPIAKPTVTGSKGGNAALASLLSALASFGLLTDSST